jgi:hypothetical protein
MTTLDYQPRWPTSPDQARGEVGRLRGLLDEQTSRTDTFTADLTRLKARREELQRVVDRLGPCSTLDELARGAGARFGIELIEVAVRDNGRALAALHVETARIRRRLHDGWAEALSLMAPYEGAVLALLDRDPPANQRGSAGRSLDVIARRLAELIGPPMPAPDDPGNDGARTAPLTDDRACGAYSAESEG